MKPLTLTLIVFCACFAQIPQEPADRGEFPGRDEVEARIQRLLSELEAAPKSGGWRRRAKIGRRIRWYQTPDETSR